MSNNDDPTCSKPKQISMNMNKNELKLIALARQELGERELTHIMGGSAGAGNCGCGCYYAGRGGSSTHDNSAANNANGMQSKKDTSIDCGTLPGVICHP